jgi:pyruvate dehydrogenase E1 component beta subunit
MDSESVISSVERTGRCVIVQEAPQTCGVAAELAARIGERALLSLKAPVQRVTAPDIVVPLPLGERYYYIDGPRIFAAIRRAVEF